MNHGLKPVRFDHRDYDYHRTFGVITNFPVRCMTDMGFSFPNQDLADPLLEIPAIPFGCTGETQSELCQDMDGVRYNPKFTYDKTLLMENSPEGQGCDIRDSLNSLIVFGAQRLGESDQEAFTHRRGQYFVVNAIGDMFDGIRSAVFSNHQSVSVGTPWFPEWHNIGPDGIMPIPYLPKSSTFGGFIGAIIHLFASVLFGDYFSTIPWHNYKVGGFTDVNTKGQPIRNGEVFLAIKSWQGSTFGDNGWCYMSRAVCNSVLNVPNTGAFTVGKVSTTNIQNVEFNVRNVINNLVLRLPKPKGIPPVSNADKLVVATKASLGQNLSQGTGVPYYVACAISVNIVHTRAFGFPIGGGASTAELYQALLKSSYFKKVDAPSPGCIVISPTGLGSNSSYPHGHVGIVGNYGICSNDSSTGLFSENYTVESWTHQFSTIESYPVFFFARL